MTTPLQLLLILFCIMGEAFFSGMETGIISIRRLRLRHRLRQGDAAARLLAFFVEEPDRLLGTTLVGTNVCVVVASVLWASMVTRVWGAAGTAAATLALTVTLLLFGEYIPKAWFRAQPYVRSARFVRPLRWAWTLFRPIGFSVTWLAGPVLPGRNTARQDLCALANRGELKILATEGEQHGVLTREEREMIHRTVELADKPARAIMTPLEKVVTVSSAASRHEFLDLLQRYDFSRFPVRNAKTGCLDGVVTALDVLVGDDDDDMLLNKATVPAVYIPAKAPADEIMPPLRLARQSMGLVTDDNGEVIGVVTTDDVLRQIVHNS